MLRKTSLVENNSVNQSSRNQSPALSSRNQSPAQSSRNQSPAQSSRNYFKPKSLPNNVVSSKYRCDENTMSDSCPSSSFQFSQLGTQNDTEPNYFESYFDTPMDQDRL